MGLPQRWTVNFCSFFALSALLASGAQPPERIRARIDDSRTFVLQNNTRQVVRRGIAQDAGSVSRSQAMPRMFLHFSMTEAQRAELEELLRAQQDRRSAQYHRFLTPEQFGARFGLADPDLEKVQRWLEERGFTGLQVSASRNWVSFAGTVGDAESAFGVSIHRYIVGGETHIANSADPNLPAALRGVVGSIRGLHDFPMRPQMTKPPSAQFSQGSGTGPFLAPDDWKTIYDVKPLYASGIDGAGVTIAVLGQSDIQLSDVAAFRAAANLPPNAPTVVIPPGDTDPGFADAKNLNEAYLDVEWAGAIAKNANILFITASAKTGNGVLDSLTYAIEKNVAPIVSMSYATCEADVGTAPFQSTDALLAQATAQGMTVVSSSGDAGAAACDQGITEVFATHGLAVNYPASSSYVTGVGGTEFTNFDSTYWSSTNDSAGGSALSYVPENAWDDAFQAATGGGASTLVAKPAWQTGSNVPADGARDVPDVAFAASWDYAPYLYCGRDWCTDGFQNASSEVDLIGGTSAAAPTFAGLLALVLETKGAGNRLGNINPNLYSLAQISGNSFHDIIYGGNYQGCELAALDCDSYGQLGYNAGPGYDLATGLGSVDAYNFAEQWYGDIALTATPTALRIAPGSSATATIAVEPQNNFSGDISFGCSVDQNLIDVTCSVSPDSVNTSGTLTVTISAASTAHIMHRLPPLRLHRRGGTLQLILSAALVLLLLAGAMIGWRAPWVPRPLPYAFFVGVLLLAGVAVSCGGSGSSTSSSVVGTVTANSLTLTCDVALNAAVGSSYSGQCSASGGTGTLTYSISSGSLPAGLTLNSTTGTITGTPTAIGTSSFTIEASDSGSGGTASQAIANFPVAAAPLVLSCAIQDPLLVGATYNGGCTAAGGVGPMTYAISSGTLPPGLGINANTGALTGSASPPAAIGGGYSFAVTVTDSENPPKTTTQTTYRSVQYTTEFVLFCPYLTEAAFESPYGSGCEASGGYPPYTFSLVAGSLPPGITMNSNGIFTGTPTAQGTSSFTVQVTDSQTPADIVSQPETLTVGSRLTETGLVTITATSGGVVNTTAISVTVPFQ